MRRVTTNVRKGVEVDGLVGRAAPPMRRLVELVSMAACVLENRRVTVRALQTLAGK